MKTHIIMKQFKLIGDGTRQIFSNEKDAMKAYRKEVMGLTTEVDNGELDLTEDFTVKLLYRNVNEETGEKTEWNIYNQCTFFAKEDPNAPGQDQDPDKDDQDDDDADQDDQDDDLDDDDEEENKTIPVYGPVSSSEPTTTLTGNQKTSKR